ncbi:MAG: TRAP transporter large permease [Spirochaetaceae bacterium]|jgi:tripartite ATP-independent transporter DctM subunit|nr:TRAP transporter large permease [Spirochaetaceae bacterium]
MNPVITLLVCFVVLVIIRVPLAFAMGLSSLVVMVQLGIPLVSVANQMFNGINSFTLLAVPFFMLLGQLLNTGGITERLLVVSNAWIGHIKGGLAHVNVLASMLFAGLSGSSTADTVGIGGMLIPAQIKAGYDKEYTVAITACSSVLGVIIPPSVLMVFYGAMAQLSVGALFLGGVVPGLLIGLSQMGYNVWRSNRMGYPKADWVPWKQKFIRTGKALPALSIPIIILGGITAGIVTATEAAALTVFVALVLVYLVYREVPLKDLPKILGEGVVAYALAMFALACASPLAWLIAYFDAPAAIANFMMNITSSYFGLYTLLVVFMLIIGTFLSPAMGIIIFMPIFQSVGQAAGINPIHLGITVVICLALGQVTPPYGMCLLIACQIGKASIPKSFMACIPILVLALGVVFLGIAFPNLFLFLPKLLMPTAFY